MARIVWDKTGERLYETGVRNGVLYVQTGAAYPNGVAWNGLTSITESPSGAEATALYADDIKYLNLMSAEEFGATIEAYTYPDEFAQCDGTAELVTGVSIGQQSRKSFGLCYRTEIGDDVDGTAHGYKIHIIYGCQASPSEKGYQTINDSPEAITFSWEVKTTPVNVTGKQATASLVIDSTKVNSVKLAQLEDILYGTAANAPRLPLPDEIAALVGATGTSYPVTCYFGQCAGDNAAAVASGAYVNNLTANDGYQIANVLVTMDGADITSTAYTSATKKVNISSVTGPVVITATTKAQ